MLANNEELITRISKTLKIEITGEKIDDIIGFLRLNREINRTFEQGDAYRPLKFRELVEVIKVYLNYSKATGHEMTSLLEAKKTFLSLYTLGENLGTWSVRFDALLGTTGYYR